MFEITIWGNKLVFETAEGLFSPMAADRGTLAMLRNVELPPDTRLLDLGCGYGLVGIAAAKVIGDGNVFMVDNNPEAARYSEINARLNSVPDVTIACGDGATAFIDTDFSMVLCNPPYHVDFSVAKDFITNSFKRLRTGGRLVLVVKRLDWYKNKLVSVFGGVKVIEDDGYYILISEKRDRAVICKKKPAMTKKHLKKIGQSVKKKRDVSQ